MSVQEEAAKAGVGLLLLQPTVPDGENPSTRAVQVVLEPAATESGEQETEVDESAWRRVTLDDEEG